VAWCLNLACQPLITARAVLRAAAAALKTMCVISIPKTKRMGPLYKSTPDVSIALLVSGRRILLPDPATDHCGDLVKSKI